MILLIQGLELDLSSMQSIADRREKRHRMGCGVLNLEEHTALSGIIMLGLHILLVIDLAPTFT